MPDLQPLVDTTAEFIDVYTTIYYAEAIVGLVLINLVLVGACALSGVLFYYLVK